MSKVIEGKVASTFNSQVSTFDPDLVLILNTEESYIVMILSV